MNREEAKKIWPVLKEFSEGKLMECAYKNETKGHWTEHTDEFFDYKDLTYRIKPEPREFWINMDSRTAMLADDGWNPSTIDPIRDIKVREVLE